MTCSVPGCNASNQEYLVEFPHSSKLADRWRKAIELGTGRRVPARPAQQQQALHLCLSHFSGDDYPNISYREPCLFRDREGKAVEISSCRLCLNFEFRPKMFPKAGKMEHVSLSSTIRAVMKVSLAPDDFLTEICERCLVKIDVLKSWARETIQQELNFRELMSLVRQEDTSHTTMCDEASIKVEAILTESREEEAAAAAAAAAAEVEHVEMKHDVKASSEAVRAPTPNQSAESVEKKPIESVDEKLDETKDATEDDEDDNYSDVAKETVDVASSSPSSSSSSSEDDDDKPLMRLRRKRKKATSEDKEFVPKVRLKRGRKPKPKEDKPKKEAVVKKKRGRKPGSPKPPRQEYLRHILAKKCYICDIFLENIDELVAHLTAAHAGKIAYECTECKKSFGKVTIYNRHLSCHDITVRPRKCQFCSLCFSAKESLKIHENKVHGADHALPKRYKRRPKVYQCESCGKIFLNDSLLKQHDLFQHKKMPAATCKLCGKTFATKANLEKHYIVHSNERPYKCDKCDASYKTSTALTKHSLLHQNVLPYECRYCEERFLTQGQYSRHRFLNHKNEVSDRKHNTAITRAIPCAICQEVFGRSTDLQKHINDNHSGQPYPYLTCPECPQQFLQLEQLNTHSNIHTDRYVCETCNKPHSSLNQLRDHMESHNPSQPWQCTICLKRFSLQSNFSRHRLIHLDEKRFKCDLCDKGFSQKGQLMNHRRTHTGERPFACPICDKAFGDKPTFYKHRKKCIEKDVPVGQRLAPPPPAGNEAEEEACEY